MRPNETTYIYFIKELYGEKTPNRTRGEFDPDPYDYEYWWKTMFQTTDKAEAEKILCEGGDRRLICAIDPASIKCEFQEERQ